MRLFLRINSGCNQDCLFCSEKDKHIKVDSEELKKTVIDFSEKHESKSISITGGEPTLDFNVCVDIIKLSSSLGFEEIELQTNAVLLENEKMARALKKAGLGRSLVSLHSHKEHTSNILTGSNDFQKTLKGIRNLLDSDIKVSISIVINKLNCDHLSLVVKHIKEKFGEINHFHFGFPAFQGNVLKNLWIVPSFSEIGEELKKTFEFCERKGIEKTCCGFPLCHLGSYGSALQEQKFDFTTKENGKYYSINKIKVLQCKRCQLNERCPRIYPEYVSIFGKDEIKPK